MSYAAVARRTSEKFGRSRCARWLGVLSLVIVAAADASHAHAQGVYLPSIGPTNQSFGGAAVAAPIDSAGALYWNPATLSGLKSSEMAFGLGIVSPHAELSSTVGGVSGSTHSDAGVIPVPTIGWVQKSNDSPWTYGIGIFGVGGFGLNYPGDTTNPILNPQPAGLGRVYSSAEIYQVVPTASLALTDRLSFGVAPVVTLAKISLDPLFVAPPVGGAYDPGTGTKYSWGAGVQAGVYYITDYDFHLGASIKSPQWMESFRYHSQTPGGTPFDAKFGFDMPLTVSLGTAYTGFDRLTVATDVRFLDWSHTKGFAEQGYNPNTFAVNGLGWRSTWAVSVGSQYELTDRLTLRSGWQYMQNPIPHGQTMFNIPSALIIQNWASVGAGYKLRRNVIANIAYSRGLEQQQEGPVVLPGGVVPNTVVRSKISADIFTFGVTVTY